MAKTVTHKDLKSYFGEKDHLTLSQTRSFASLIYELLTEKEPSTQELKLFELILNLSLDHGPETPSAFATIKASQKGETISQSLAEGILQINDTHGGAAEPLMEIFYQIKNQKSAPKEVVQSYLSSNSKMPGFGHRIYKDNDPRAEIILSQVTSIPDGEAWIKISQELRSELNKKLEKSLPLNIDGAIAVALCALGFEPKLGKAIFLIARTPGLIAHFLNNTHSQS